MEKLKESKSYMPLHTFYTLFIILSLIILCEVFFIGVKFSSTVYDWWYPRDYGRLMDKIQSR